MDKENTFKAWLLSYKDLTPCYDEQEEIGQKSQSHMNQVSTKSKQSPCLHEGRVILAQGLTILSLVSQGERKQKTWPQR
jgi:hypothetical protein